MNLPRAQYLLRLDGLCPTMSKERFERFIVIADRHGIRPILAVVPDNQDPALKAEDPDSQFWLLMRSLEKAGATIAMHGYRHLCLNPGRSLLGLHHHTEFAGVSEETQREWIRDGLRILRTHGLNPRLFVAPRHGFDSATLRALASEKLGYLSDGFATRPHLRNGVVWIPQQLSKPVRRSHGLWTIRVRTDTACVALEEELNLFLDECANQFTDFDTVTGEGQPSKLNWSERIREMVMAHQIRSANM